VSAQAKRGGEGEGNGVRRIKTPGRKRRTGNERELGRGRRGGRGGEGGQFKGEMDEERGREK